MRGQGQGIVLAAVAVLAVADQHGGSALLVEGGAVLQGGHVVGHLRADDGTGGDVVQVVLRLIG